MTVTRLQNFGETIFATMTRLATEANTINLGQGFPDWDGPDVILAEAQRQIGSGNNQYAPGRGVQELRDAVVADRAHRLAQHYDADTECLITVGATEAITASVLGLVEPGGHVVVIEPYYDAYTAAIALAGARYSAVPLRPTGDEFRLNIDALESAVTDDTAMIIINSPHNPTGSVLTREELTRIADLAQQHDCLVLADEVYERLHFDDAAHLSIASLPDMRERTIVVSSAAKTLNATGWKTGWALAPAPLLDGIFKAKQFLTYVGVTPVQAAVAKGLNECDVWVDELRHTLQDNHDVLATGLRNLGAKVYESAAGYFIVADVSAWFNTTQGHAPTATEGHAPTAAVGHAPTALEACTFLVKTAGVAAIPVCAFVDDPETYAPGSCLVRFAFCKKPAVIEQALNQLQDLLSDGPVPLDLD